MSYEMVQVIPDGYKKLTCQVKHCVRNDGNAGCDHEWMELDDMGRCIFINIEKVVTHPITGDKHTLFTP